MSERSIRILCRIDWPNGDISRLWQGAGPVIDSDGEKWLGTTIIDGLDEVEQAINGEAYMLAMTLTGVSRSIGSLAWLEFTNDQIVGAKVQLMIQECDRLDQPVGAPEVRFTGTIDNPLFDDTIDTSGDAPRPMTAITVEVVNLFTLRRLKRGAVLSDVDQRARSAVLNPDAAPDRFCERVPTLEDKTIVWPRWN